MDSTKAVYEIDWLVGIIKVHCAGGEEQDDGVELVLD